MFYFIFGSDSLVSPPPPNSRRGAHDIRSYAKEPPGTAQVKSIRREHTNRPQPRWLTMILRGWWEWVRGPLHNHEGGILSGDEGREGGHPLNLLNQPDAGNSTHHTTTSTYTEQKKWQVLTRQNTKSSESITFNTLWDGLEPMLIIVCGKVCRLVTTR